MVKNSMYKIYFYKSDDMIIIYVNDLREITKGKFTEFQIYKKEYEFHNLIYKDEVYEWLFDIVVNAKKNVTDDNVDLRLLTRNISDISKYVAYDLIHNGNSIVTINPKMYIEYGE